ncbi:MAG: GAF domain-containing protein [Desulfobacteraceae bacterium]|nr:GAF domain-containing protein [Desulfobacteraceae bacterium]
MTREKDYFRTFCKISKAFGTAASREELLELIVESAITTMDGMASCLFLADETTDTFVPMAQKGLSESYLHASPMKARRIVSAILDGGYLAFRDATTDKRLENHEEKKAEGIASILTVPVRVKDETIGVLSLYTATQRDFSEEEIEFLKALADQGGMAVKQAGLLERIQSNALLFLELASMINSSLEIRDILKNLTVEVCKALEMKAASIRLLDKDSQTLKLVASHGLSDAYLDKGTISPTRSLSRVMEGHLEVVRDVTTDERIQYPDKMRAEGIASMISAPIKSRDEVIGVLRLFSAEPRDFPEETLVVVKALAHQGALAIQNATMLLQLQEDKKSLEEDIWSHRSWF